MNKVTKEEATKAIQTICQAAMINIMVTGEIDEGLTPQLEATASALQRHFGLDTTVMDAYRNCIEEAKTAEAVDEIPYTDAEDARDTVYFMCEELTDPKEIMQHVFNMCSMLYILEPNGYPEQR